MPPGGVCFFCSYRSQMCTCQRALASRHGWPCLEAQSRRRSRARNPQVRKWVLGVRSTRSWRANLLHTVYEVVTRLDFLQHAKNCSSQQDRSERNKYFDVKMTLQHILDAFSTNGPRCLGKLRPPSSANRLAVRRKPPAPTSEQPQPDTSDAKN